LTTSWTRTRTRSSTRWITKTRRRDGKVFNLPNPFMESIGIASTSTGTWTGSRHRPQPADEDAAVTGTATILILLVLTP
jgi:hypothetical protein